MVGGWVLVGGWRGGWLGVRGFGLGLELEMVVVVVVDDGGLLVGGLDVVSLVLVGGGLASGWGVVAPKVNGRFMVPLNGANVKLGGCHCWGGEAGELLELDG